MLPSASTEPEQLASLTCLAVEITGDHLELACLAWRAYRAPTPQAWFNLLNADLSPLPRLRSCVLALLEELPNQATGLGATEARILELISAGDARPLRCLPGSREAQQEARFPLLGNRLAARRACAMPGARRVRSRRGAVLAGDAPRPNSAREVQATRLSLTASGESGAGGKGGFRRHNPIRRWWGGTEVTNQLALALESDSRTLVAP